MIVPGAAALVALAEWREDHDAVFPSVTGLPDYYEEMSAESVEFVFTVAAYDDKARYVTKALTIQVPHYRKMKIDAGMIVIPGRTD